MRIHANPRPDPPISNGLTPISSCRARITAQLIRFSYFVVIFCAEDLPRKAHAVSKGEWRDLNLVKPPPLPADL
jgi:hypothetical protein